MIIIKSNYHKDFSFCKFNCNTSQLGVLGGVPSYLQKLGGLSGFVGYSPPLLLMLYFIDSFIPLIRCYSFPTPLLMDFSFVGLEN